MHGNPIKHTYFIKAIGATNSRPWSRERSSGRGKHALWEKFKLRVLESEGEALSLINDNDSVLLNFQIMLLKAPHLQSQRPEFKAVIILILRRGRKCPTN